MSVHEDGVLNLFGVPIDGSNMNTLVMNLRDALLGGGATKAKGKLIIHR